MRLWLHLTHFKLLIVICSMNIFTNNTNLSRRIKYYELCGKLQINYLRTQSKTKQKPYKNVAIISSKPLFLWSPCNIPTYGHQTYALKSGHRYSQILGGKNEIWPPGWHWYFKIDNGRCLKGAARDGSGGRHDSGIWICKKLRDMDHVQSKENCLAWHNVWCSYCGLKANSHAALFYVLYLLS